VLPPAEFPEPHDHERSPEPGPAPHASARDGQHKSLRVSFQFEIGRSESAREPETGHGPAASGTRAERGNQVRRWLRRVLGPALAGKMLVRPAGSGQPTQPRPAGSSPAAELAPARTAVSFWETLDPTEREELRSMASLVTFPPGYRLMQEGQPADHVVVILKGRTRVCVDEHGWERLLAERGPGELIGERGGLAVRTRSASVTAIDQVRGLVVTTADFYRFIVDHPRVLDIVESQLYDRLTEDPVRYRPPNDPDALGVLGASATPETVRPGYDLLAAPVAPQPLSGQNCTVILTDVSSFGSSARNDEDRRAIREALYGMTNMMLRDISGVRSEDRGDGLLTVVPPGVPTADVVARVIKDLPQALGRYNVTHRDSARIQLRVAVNVGPVTTDTMGVSGEAIIIAARLVDAPIFKKIISKSPANLGLIVSPFVYETVIRHSSNPIDLIGYARVQVRVKDFTVPAWIKLFGVPPTSAYFPQSAVSDPLGN
jgi:hypothetical protein